jgi:hypothetical protein
MSDHPRAQWQAYLDRATQDRIGRELRVMFAEPLRQPLPDRLLGALRAIEEAEEAVTRVEGPTVATLARPAQAAEPRRPRFAERSGSFEVAETERFAVTW